MKRIFTKALCLVCAGALALSLAACGGKADSAASSTASSSALGSASDYDYQNFNYSDGLDEKGYWEGIRALDYVTLPEDFASVAIKRSDIEPTSEEVDEQISNLLSQHSSTEHITDRAAADGDTVNINYVGSVNNVEFTGGSAENYDLTLGSGTFIDGFEDQIIGHKPGETFDIKVTFPDPYERNTELSGKDAVFTVTINKIIVTHTYELTDDFVKDNLKDDYGYTSVENMRQTIAKDLRDSQVYDAMMETILKNCPVSEVPQKLVDNEITIVIKQLKFSALQYSMELSTLLNYYYGVESEEAFRTKYEENIRETISQYMVMMAIAEDMNLFATEDDVKEYFKTEMDTEDYSEYVAQYGYGYIYRAVTFNNVGQYLQEQNPAPAYTDISEIIVPAATDDTTAEENTETPAA